MREQLTSSADEGFEQRRAERRLQLLEVSEWIAAKAESATTSELRAAYAQRYQGIVGVRPESRQALRAALAARNGVSVDDIVASIDRAQPLNGF